MRDDPEGDNLARLMAAEEAEIRDDDFSVRIADGMHRQTNLRLAIIGGAGLAGLASRIVACRPWTRHAASQVRN